MGPLCTAHPLSGCPGEDGLQTWSSGSGGSGVRAGRGREGWRSPSGRWAGQWVPGWAEPMSRHPPDPSRGAGPRPTLPFTLGHSGEGNREAGENWLCVSAPRPNPLPRALRSQRAHTRALLQARQPGEGAGALWEGSQTAPLPTPRHRSGGHHAGRAPQDEAAVAGGDGRAGSPPPGLPRQARAASPRTWGCLRR